MNSPFQKQSLQHREFGEPGPFWGRYYIFWHQGRALTVIHEVFSPAMRQWLGPVQTCR